MRKKTRKRYRLRPERKELYLNILKGTALLFGFVAMMAIAGTCEYHWDVCGEPILWWLN